MKIVIKTEKSKVPRKNKQLVLFVTLSISLRSKKIEMAGAADEVLLEEIKEYKVRKMM